MPNLLALISPELVFAIACIQKLWQSDSALELKLAAITDWKLFLQLAHNHQLTPIIYRALAEAKLLAAIPEFAQKNLMKRSQYCTQHNLQLAAKTLQLIDYFADAGIRTLPLKGSLLAVQLYGNKVLRQSRDIDLWIEPNAYPNVKILLRSLGYCYARSESESWSTRLEALYLSQQGEMTWWDEASRTTVDIHLRLFTNSQALPISFEGAWAGASSLPFQKLGLQQNRAVNLLSMEHQALFLSVHGAKHQWSRLLWLTDLALMVQNASQLDLVWHSVFDQAEQLGVSRSLGQGLNLIEQAFEIPIPDPWHTVCKSKSVRFLASTIVTQLQTQAEFEQPGTLTTPPVSFRRIGQELRYTTYLQSRWRYKLSCLMRLLISAKDWQILPLPSYLWFFYIPLRPILYGYRRFKRPSD